MFFRPGVVLIFLRLSVLVQVNLQRSDVVFEPEHRHRTEKIVAVDGLPLLPLAFVGGFAGDEAYELRHAFLDGFLRFFGDLGVGGERLLHDPADVGDWEEPFLVFGGGGVGGRAPGGAVVQSSFSGHGDYVKIHTRNTMREESL